METRPILVVIGTRPEAIKLAPVVRALRDDGRAPVRVCLTGQHRELLRQGLSAFDLTIDRDLDLMAENQHPADVAARVLTGIAGVIREEIPRWVVVQGDTTTAMAAALAAFQSRVPVAHVEAGLRSGDPSQPWPEEVNRRLISQVASLHFAPTERARANLLAEGTPAAAVRLTGNTIVDALHLALARIDADPSLGEAAAPGLRAAGSGRALVLVTVHRRENLGEPLAAVGRALERLAARGDCAIVFPAHPNPQVTAMARALAERCPDLHVVPPLDYLPFVALLRRADLILTDSGGIQEEAAALGKPVLVLRDRTERPEVLDGGNGHLVGTGTDAVVVAAARLIDNPEARAAMTRAHDSFGDGRASRRIADALLAD